MKHVSCLLFVVAVAFAFGFGCGGGGSESDGCSDEQVEAAKKRCTRCLDACPHCADPFASCIHSCRPCDL